MTNSLPFPDAGNDSKPWKLGCNNLVPIRIAKCILLLVGVAVLGLVIYNSADPFGFIPGSFYSPAPGQVELETVLKDASMKDRTVILTTLNDAWAEPGSMFDLFLESFRIGNGTQKLLKYLVVICLDQKAYKRCLSLHPHCYDFESTGTNFAREASFMTPTYLEMMWARIDFLASVLEKGYNFVFTDTDVMWLQDPFQRFYADADFQIACDQYNGDSYDKNNAPNGGFTYVKSNHRTIEFYKFWYKSREAYPSKHDQDVLNQIKNHPFLTKIGLQMRFLDTNYFGGFCSPSHNFNLVCTMHANCCIGLQKKIYDLKLLLEDWKRFMSLAPDKKAAPPFSWSVPQKCRGSFGR